jgi:Ni/Co efflux regulator RcnB
MKRLLIALLLAASIEAQDVAQRVADDATAIDRVAAASKRDLPTDLLRRIVDEDVELLRGRRNDGSYQYASFERFDTGRITQDFSVQHRGDKMEVLELKAPWVYRLQIEVPSRRLLVRKNRPVWIERVDLEYIAERGSQTERQTIEVKQWLKPGEFRPVDLPQIARQATARVVATVEDGSGYGNVELALIKAKIVDNPDSPYGDAVASAKAIQRALDNSDVASMRAMAQRLRRTLGGGAAAAAGSRIEVVAQAPATPPPAPQADRAMRDELQEIEDLLTGSDQERREGMDRLHQLLRRLRQ